MRQLLVSLPFAAIAIAQQSAPDPTFRVDTELIQTSVIVQNKDGKPVTGLKREDFRIFDDGLAQEIRLFEAESETSPPEPSGPNTRNLFTNQRTPGGSHSGYAVILIDALHTDFGDPVIGVEGSGSAISRTRRLLKSLPPGEKIALYALQRKLQIICEFTSDRNLLERRLYAWKLPIDNPVNSRQIMEDALAPRKEIAEASRIDSLQRVDASNDVMAQVAGHLAGIPGRKNLIWIADVFPISGADLQKFSDAGVAIYPVDAYGVCPFVPLTNSPDFVTCPPRPIDAMNAIASFTGGLAYYLRNDFDVAAREALDDGRVSYTLGFYRSGNDRAPQTHRLTIQTTRPGVILRYRMSYRNGTPQTMSGNPKADAIRALNTPVDATAIPLAVSVTPAGDRLRLHALLDIRSLNLVPDHGQWTAKITLLARFTDAEGRMVGEASDQTLTLNLRQATYEKAVQSGFAHELQLRAPPKASELKLLFMNPSTGKIGTVTVPLSDLVSDASK